MGKAGEDGQAGRGGGIEEVEVSGGAGRSGAVRGGRGSGWQVRWVRAGYGQEKLFPMVGYFLVYRKFYRGVSGKGKRRYVPYVSAHTIYETVKTVDLSPPCKECCRLT